MIELETILSIYAVGDCNVKYACPCSFQGKVRCSGNLMGIESKMDYKVIPACVSTKLSLHPSDLRKEQAIQKELNIRWEGFHNSKWQVYYNE